MSVSANPSPAVRPLDEVRPSAPMAGTPQREWVRALIDLMAGMASYQV